jgi:hypothetical protein
VCGSWRNGSHLGSQGTRPAREGKRRAVGIRQWRRIDIAGCVKTREAGSSQHQATFMHRVSVIVHCIIVVTSKRTITGTVFNCISCFRKINHLVVKHQLHSSSGVREVVSSTVPSHWCYWKLSFTGPCGSVCVSVSESIVPLFSPHAPLYS